MAALPTDPINLMDPYATASTSTSRRPDWVLLHPSARTSDLHNATTLVSRTRDGQPVVASFWLVDPPGVSYFSVHCPGLKVSDPDDFSHDDPYPGLIGADVVCAEAALLLFGVSFNTPDADGPVPESTHHFVYRAGPGQPALHLLPDPDVPAYEALPQFGLLPCGEHYAVAFLRWNKTMGDHMFDVHVFSSQTKAWSKKVALLSISKSDKRYFYGHDTSKQITIGSSLGFVDLLRGILLLRNPFNEHPVIEYIPFPASRPPCSADDDEQGGSDVPQYFRDVACCDDSIKFVNVEYHDPSSCRPCCGRDKSWKTTIWSRKLSSGDWRRGFTVDVADISLDQSYSALLPELWDDETENLHRLKKLIFYTPTLSICDDDLLYVMSKVNDEDDKAWVITVDMKNAVVQAVAPFSAGDIDFLPMYRPCSFPKYLNMTPGIDITNTAHKYFTRMDVEKCIEELLWTRDWLKELGQCLELERSVYIDCSSLHFSPVSSLRFTTPAVVEYASSVGEGKAKAASKAVDVCLRALEDFNLLLRKPPSDASTSTKAMRRKINTALKALKNVLQIAPQSMMAGGTTMDGVTTLANACHQKRRKPVFERGERPGHKIEYIQPGFSGGNLFCDRRKKAGHEKDKCDELQVELNRQLELNLHGSLGPWLSSLPPDVWFILAIAFSALVCACLQYVNS